MKGGDCVSILCRERFIFKLWSDEHALNQSNFYVLAQSDVVAKVFTASIVEKVETAVRTFQFALRWFR